MAKHEARQPRFSGSPDDYYDQVLWGAERERTIPTPPRPRRLTERQYSEAEDLTRVLLDALKRLQEEK